MTKLEGNNRWGGKFIMIEHREQYEQRGKPKLTGPPTKEELRLIRNCIVFPHILKMIQKSRDDIETA